ncbi:MAG: thioesterase family protein [Cyanobacteria bacterium REEB65]|nr:thioesterase family protein [Cyanobacteria bacterium REEB65]
MGHASTVVSSENIAVTMGSGTLSSLATPAVVALAEQAAMQAVQGALPLGMTTIGTEIHLKHLAATPPGHNIQAEAVVTRVSGRRLQFSIKAFDEREKIAEGTHERFIIEAERFMNRLADKKPKA